MNEYVEKILEEFKKSNMTLKDLEKIVNKYLSEYNEEVKKEIEDKIIQEVGAFYFINTNPEVLITPVELSSRLYNNLKDTSNQAKKILREYIKAKKTINEIARKLYDGYDFNDKEVLDVKKNLPKYLLNAINKKEVYDELKKQVDKLKTSGLKASYKKIIKLLEEESFIGMQDALKTALEEKARYYANRIALTETSRAFNLKRMSEYLKDDSIEFVKFNLNATHPKFDICDFYANLDVGYGKGVYPKSAARTLPLHPHCNCFYTPAYNVKKRKTKSIEEAGREFLDGLSNREKRDILGSFELVEKFKAGKKIEDIFNAIRPKYKIREYGDILKNINFNIDVVNDLKKMLKELKQKKKLSKNKIIVGELDSDIVSFLKERGVPIHTKEIYLNHKGLSHLSRQSKKQRGAGLNEDDILQIPIILANPSAVFFEKIKNKLNLLYCNYDNNRCIKLVVDTKFIYKGEKITLIKTAGYVKPSDLKNPLVEIIYGKWNY